MRVYISVDMEGITGVADRTQVTPGERDYERFRRVMTREANAAIEGAVDGGATEVLVNDSHGPMTNLLIEDLHPAARLISGRPKPHGMMQGIGPGWDAAFFIGYHSRHGTAASVLDHTWSSATIVHAELNGRPVCEGDLNAGLAGEFGVPAVLMLALSVAMHLDPDVGLDTVVRRLRRDRRLREPEAAVPATSGAICQARRRLGARPVVALFRQVARPLATPETPGAFRFGLRLMAVDGTVEDVPDSPANAQAFGRGRNQHQPTAFPQVRGVYLAECGTHAIIDAGVWPIGVGEPRGARRLLRSVTPEMLLIWDRGLHSFTLATAVRARQAQFLGRVPATARLTPDTWLADGSALAWWTPPDRGGQRSAPSLRVRLISYTLHDPERPGYLQPHRLVTSLLDPTLAPAHDLAEAFHDRWEIELTINELATAQRRRRPLRSRTPIGVLQELYGLLVAHYAIRATMHAAAQPVGLDPRRLSFTHATRLIIETLPDFHGVAPTTQARLYARLLAELRRYRLPPRRLRSYPRVCQRRRSRYPPKRPHHRPAALTTTFREAVILI